MTSTPIDPEHPLRVLVVIKTLALAGAQRVVVETLRHADRRRFAFTVAFVLPRWDALAGEIESLGVPVHCIGGRFGVTPRAGHRLRRLAASADAHLVHAHLPATGVLARRYSPVPVVYTEHGLTGSYRPLTRIANRRTYGRNAAVIAVSRAVADSVAGYPGPVPLVIPNGVSVAADPAGVATVRSELGITPDTPLIVHVGNLAPGKGHDALIAAAAVLRHDRPDAVVVSIGGEDRPGAVSHHRRQAERAGADVRFLGSRADALRFVAAADVYLHPSSDEASGLAVLEAMALRRPVVATAVGGVSESITDGVTGVLVPPGRPEALAAATARVLDDPVAARNMGSAAAAHVAAHHRPEAMVRAVEQVYRGVAAGRGAAEPR